MFELDNTIRDYHWGSENQITELLGLPQKTSPQAEMWIGAHPGCPSHVTEKDESLDQVIAREPQRILGPEIAQRYGSLPFLFKVLSASQPLSIQVHPTLDQAKERFAAENASGKPLNAADRNYRDDNHKPEMLYALTDFAALSGFREPAAIIADIQLLTAHVDGPALTVLETLAAKLESHDPLNAALEYVLGSNNGICEAVDGICSAISSQSALQEHVQLAELVRINGIYPQDCGVLVALLLNLVFLSPGQAISLAAGNVHAYLRGLGIEVMANSDNVLRGGLTSKHIDVHELLDVTIAKPAAAPILQPTVLSSVSSLYKPDFDEFQLQVLSPAQSGAPEALELNGAGVLLCTAGRFEIRTGQETRILSKGQSALISYEELPATASALEAGELFAASTQR